MGRDDAKNAALEVLTAIETRGAYANLLLKNTLRKLRQEDRGLATELVYGVLRRRGTLDYVLSKFLSRPLEKTDPKVRNILRMGLYQAKYMGSVHEALAVNEAVELAKKNCHKGIVPFVNGVLRTALRSDWESILPGKDEPERYLSVRYSHPTWLVKHWLEYLGFEETEKTCQANNEIPPTTIRVNTLKATVDSVVKRLKGRGVTVEKGLLPEALHIRDYPAIETLPEFEEGLFVVQDEGSMLVTRFLNPQPGETVYDLCAAPGGKTSHIAALTQNKGSVMAVDPHPHKATMMEEIFLRLDARAAVVCADARNLPEAHEGKADRVLIDAPCSGLGVLRRKPDIRWKKEPEDVEKLTMLQRELLEAGLRFLKPGGRMVYSTCTISPKENEDNIEWLSVHHPEVHVVDVFSVPEIPEWIRRNARQLKAGILLLPQYTGTDGFFISVMFKS